MIDCQQTHETYRDRTSKHKWLANKICLNKLPCQADDYYLIWVIAILLIATSLTRTCARFLHLKLFVQLIYHCVLFLYALTDTCAIQSISKYAYVPVRQKWFLACRCIKTGTRDVTHQSPAIFWICLQIYQGLCVIYQYIGENDNSCSIDLELKATKKTLLELFTANVDPH